MNDAVIQQLIQKIKSLEEEKASMALRIQALETKNVHLTIVNKIMRLSSEEEVRAKPVTQVYTKETNYESMMRLPNLHVALIKIIVHRV